MNTKTNRRDEMINKEMVRNWEKWEGKKCIDIYYSPSGLVFDGDDGPGPDMIYVIYDKERKHIHHVGHVRNPEEIGYSIHENYEDKIYEEFLGMGDFIYYIIEKYGREMKN